MAHFAELDDNNVVLRVHVVNDNDTQDENGNEVESIGAAFCNATWGGRWIQTSYNGKIRSHYAGIGYTYRPDIDAFIPIKLFPSWILNEETKDWQAPVPRPEDELMYDWNEETVSWEPITFEVTD
jgi:hypothetical protein